MATKNSADGEFLAVKDLSEWQAAFQRRLEGRHLHDRLEGYLLLRDSIGGQNFRVEVTFTNGESLIRNGVRYQQ